MTRGGQIDILYAEDEPAHAELFRRVLQNIPIQASLKHVTDGLQALDYLYRRGGYEHLKSAPLPDLILLDLHMPQFDGIQVLRLIKLDHLLTHIPVVILSATDTAFPQQDNSLNANSYLVKPTDMAQLITMAETLCHRYCRHSDAEKRYFGNLSRCLGS